MEALTVHLFTEVTLIIRVYKFGSSLAHRYVARVVSSVHLASAVAIVVLVMISSQFMYCLGPSNVVMIRNVNLYSSVTDSNNGSQ